MIAGIHQLHYLPWLRYFDKIDLCDVFVVLDDAQYNQNGWQNRNRIKGPEGPILLTVPVGHRFGQRLDEVRISGHGAWREKHWRSLELHYGRAPHFARYRDDLRAFYTREWDDLNTLNFAMLDWYLQVLGIRTRIVRSSEMGVPGCATDRLVDLCRALGATAYLSGEHATHVYLATAAFERAGLCLAVQSWNCPAYPQRYPRAGFVSDLSIVDLLMNEGPASMQVLRDARPVLQAAS